MAMQGFGSGIEAPVAAPISGVGGTGGAGGAGGIGAVGNTNYALVDPSQGQSFGSQLGPLLERINALQAPSYQSLVNQGISSPLLQSILGPALANLLPGEEAGRQNFMDEFRRAGALGSGAMGSGAAKMETGFQAQRGNLISQVLSQMLPQITQGLGQEWNQNQGISQLLASVLGMSKPNVVTGTNTPGGAGGAGGGAGGWDAIPPSLGLGTPMSGGVTSQTTQNNGFDNRGQPLNPTQPDLLGNLDLGNMGGVNYGGVGLGPTPQSTYNNAAGNAGAGDVFRSNVDYGPWTGAGQENGSPGQWDNQVANLAGTGWEQYF